MTFPQRHLTTRHGTNVALFSFKECHSLTLTEDIPASTASTPTTLLRVDSVPIPLADGTVLEFKDQNVTNCAVLRFTTNGVTAVGARSINILPYIGLKVPCGITANIGAIDLTGRIYRAQVKKKLNDPTVFLTLDCTVEPLAGLVTISCNTTTTPFLDEYIDPYQVAFPKTNEALQLIDATDPKTGKPLYPQYLKAIAASYFWDLEYTLYGAGPIPDYRGRFWIQKEATL